MGRGRVELRRIENKISRQVTFSKRRSGLFKKAQEISVLCDAQVAVIIFSNKGKLYDWSSDSSLDGILEQYERQMHTEQLAEADNESKGNLSLEFYKLTTKAKILEKNIRNYGGHDLEVMGLRELQNLEQQIDTAIKRIRTRKNQLMNESISEHQKKARALQEQNNLLAKKVKDKEKTLAENPEKEKYRQGHNLQAFKVPLPQLQLPTLTLGASLQGRGSEEEEEIEARTQARRSNIIMPPWMLRHLIR
ncbi:agamous-like MADS-box protein FUL-L [Prosopis cineraria]|uniref:agamous-like MADS-box protein FUL-L n=1 Tax=Prosopis cineraria TaxID=364024 RepID=UPI0024101EBF|nr:agamous-like MADS-box protein FUL-L [Prosopis cineraria]